MWASFPWPVFFGDDVAERGGERSGEPKQAPHVVVAVFRTGRTGAGVREKPENVLSGCKNSSGGFQRCDLSHILVLEDNSDEDYAAQVLT